MTARDDIQPLEGVLYSHQDNTIGQSHHALPPSNDPNVLAYLCDAFPEAAAYPPRDQSSYPLVTSSNNGNTVATLHAVPDPRHGITTDSNREGVSALDPHLADLAAIAAADGLAGAAYSENFNHHYVDYGSLGEMGGKRKKMPHERAGWTEMDNAGPRKRGRRKGPNPGNAEEGVENAHEESPVSRAEQNKKAQQAFRRRREERMKDLENAAAALEPLQKRAAELESRLRQTTVALEASKIETSAIKSVLLDLIREHGYSILKPDGTLALHPNSAQSGENSQAELDAAFSILARQARDLASANANTEGDRQEGQ